jgi:hypothetical protein
MSDNRNFSRRGFLKGVGVAAGAMVGTRLAGSGLIVPAHAATTGKAAVISIFLDGGFNALFGSADSFRNAAFGVTDNNIKDLGNGLMVDASQNSIGSLNNFALTHMAAIGDRHGSSDHGTAQRNNFSDGARSFPIQLAAAIGGDAAFKAVALGSMPPGPSTAESGVSLQLLRTVGDAVTALGGGAPNFNIPARNVTASGLEKANAMSGGAIGKNATSMVNFKNGFETQIDSLRKPVKPIDIPGIVQAYSAVAGNGQVTQTSNLNSMKARMAAAELMIRSGTNVVTIRDGGWDTHGDRDGTTVRNKMSQNILPSVKLFLERMTTDPDLQAMNISIIIHGDFHRSLPGSDHGSGVTSLVMGPNVKVGTTGKVSANVALPPGTGGGKETWSYLAAISKVQNNPFGANPHALVL